MEMPKWLLEIDEIELAMKRGFSHSINNGRFYLSRKSDDARIWPHIDGFISCFIRQGTFVNHKKFRDFSLALDRRFGDPK
jgi:hypothetical protein